jgi:hypothetical protein
MSVVIRIWTSVYFWEGDNLTQQSGQILHLTALQQFLKVEFYSIHLLFVFFYIFFSLTPVTSTVDL